jgi:hypothetical protein
MPKIKSYKDIWSKYRYFWKFDDMDSCGWDTDAILSCPTELVKLMREMGFCYVHAGRTRWTFLAPTATKVYKIPRSNSGIRCNKWEAKYYNKRDKLKEDWQKNLARCKLMKNGILVMEHVIPVQLECYGTRDLWDADFDYDGVEAFGLPDWITMIDCEQVGRNKNGDLLMYDYGDEEWFFEK